MVEETCKNHHWGQICRVSHAFEAFKQAVQQPTHRGSSASLLSFPIITLWQGWWLCRARCAPLHSPQGSQNRFGSLHLTDNSDNSSLLGNCWTIRAVSNILLSTRAPFWNLLFQVLCPLAQAVKGVKAIWPLTEQRHLINRKLRILTWTTTFEKWERGSLNWGCHKYAPPSWAVGRQPSPI